MYIFKTLVYGGKNMDFEDEGVYSWGSESEAYFVVKDYKYLLETVPMFIEFIEKDIK